MNAGGQWVDEKSVVCHEQGYTLVTSRNPDDLDAFVENLVHVFAEAPVR